MNLNWQKNYKTRKIYNSEKQRQTKSCNFWHLTPLFSKTFNPNLIYLTKMYLQLTWRVVLCSSFCLWPKALFQTVQRKTAPLSSWKIKKIHQKWGKNPPKTRFNLYINLACLYWCLYPINVKTDEPIGPNFFV